MTKRFQRSAGALAAVALATVGVAVGSSDSGHAAVSQAGPPAPPNIVVITTDDQDARSVRVMNAVEQRLAEQGATYANSYATTPTCCPSRATFLAGQYAHNTGVHSTDAESTARFDHSRTLPVALDRAGYRTGFIGKYNLGASEPRPGWDRWWALTSDPPELFDYTLSHDGNLIHHTQ